MKIVLLLTIIILPTVLVLLIAIIFVIYLKNQRKIDKVPKKLTKFVNFDLNQRKYFYHMDFAGQKKMFKKSKSKKWNHFTNITSEFDKGINSKFSEALRNLEKGSESEKITFTIPQYHFKNHDSLFSFRFDKVQDGTDFLLTMKYNTIKKNKKQKQHNFKKIDKKDIINNGNLIKGFVAFNVLGDNENNIKRLVRIFSNIKLPKGARYIVSGGLVILIIRGRDNKYVNKKINIIKNQVENKGFMMGINQLYNGSSVAISKKANSLKNINQIIQTLIFLNNVSIEKDKPFASQKEDLEKSEFIKFNEAMKLFSKSLREGNIKTMKTVVRNFKTNKKVVEYVYPTIKGLNSNLQSSLLINKNSERALINGHAEQIGYDKNINTPVLIDVFDGWLLENYKSIKNKKAMYVIHLTDIDEKAVLFSLIEKLKENNIAYAIHLKGFDDSLATLVQNAKPKFIIIDSTIWNENNLIDSNDYIKLVTLSVLTSKNDGKLIYQNPSSLLDDKTIEEIGLKYYYEKM